MTTAEQTAYNNGFILGMASKGVVTVREKHGTDNLYLFKEGDECVNITGGWVMQATASSGAISNSDGAVFYTYQRGQYLGSYNAYAEAVMMTSGMIDLTPYDNLYVEMKTTIPSRFVKLHASANNLIPTNSNGGERNTILSDVSLTDNEVGSKVLVVDISLVNEPAFIFFRSLCNRDGSPTPSGYVYNIWLGKETA